MEIKCAKNEKWFIVFGFLYYGSKGLNKYKCGCDKPLNVHISYLILLHIFVQADFESTHNIYCELWMSRHSIWCKCNVCVIVYKKQASTFLSFFLTEMLEPCLAFMLKKNLQTTLSTLSKNYIYVNMHKIVSIYWKYCWWNILAQPVPTLGLYLYVTDWKTNWKTYNKWFIGLCSSNRWYNKAITRTEAEELLITVVKLISVIILHEQIWSNEGKWCSCLKPLFSLCALFSQAKRVFFWLFTSLQALQLQSMHVRFKQGSKTFKPVRLWGFLSTLYRMFEFECEGQFYMLTCEASVYSMFSILSNNEQQTVAN